jgi:hypothetical protein
VKAKFTLLYRPGPEGLLQEGTNTSCRCSRFLMYDSSPCAYTLNIRNAQSQVISPTTLIWATARYKQGTARGLISPSVKPRAVAIGALSGANARVGGATQDFFGLIGGHVGQG